MNGRDRAEMDPLIQFFKVRLEIIGDFFYFFFYKMNFIECFGGLFSWLQGLGA